ncbi:FAD-dependent oxidoreductase, partial [Mesorhizobium sp. M4B.F.Ca.ET.169.01.1.1]|uniref:FAD-dependent oxidoreductase n=1 Tax=Mesorhizobium sp. M4B.F.Ca.ET.169.01.1.1 TaxID=2563949 RepID=UPI0010935BA3
MKDSFDLAVVGSGIIGLAHALAAARRGLRVVVIDRDQKANGASMRNFGLVVVTGEEPGPSRRLAERSREIWLELAQEARLDILHRGKLIAAQR